MKLANLLVSDELELLDSNTDVLGSSRDADEIGWVVRLGDADVGGSLIHDFLDSLAFLADDEGVVSLGNGNLGAGLCAETRDKRRETVRTAGKLIS